MVHCEIHIGCLIIDCVPTQIDYVLEQLEYIPHYKLRRDGHIYAVVVDKEFVYDALLALAECENLEVS